MSTNETERRSIKIEKNVSERSQYTALYLISVLKKKINAVNYVINVFESMGLISEIFFVNVKFKFI